jgi:hypothetical protein
MPQNWHERSLDAFSFAHVGHSAGRPQTPRARSKSERQSDQHRDGALDTATHEKECPTLDARQRYPPRRSRQSTLKRVAVDSHSSGCGDCGVDETAASSQGTGFSAARGPMGARHVWPQPAQPHPRPNLSALAREDRAPDLALRTRRRVAARARSPRAPAVLQQAHRPPRSPQPPFVPGARVEPARPARWAVVVGAVPPRGDSCAADGPAPAPATTTAVPMPPAVAPAPPAAAGASPLPASTPRGPAPPAAA